MTAPADADCNGPETASRVQNRLGGWLVDESHLRIRPAPSERPAGAGHDTLVRLIRKT